MKEKQEKNEKDKTDYKTIKELKHTIIAKIPQTKFSVILDKENFKQLYKIAGSIIYIDEHILIAIANTGNKKDKKKYTLTLLTHTGEILGIFKNTKEFIKITDTKYIIQSTKSFSDSLIEYKTHNKSIKNLTTGRSYIIKPINEKENCVYVQSMTGGTFEHNFKTNKSKNLFTDKEEYIQLWNLT